MTQVRSVTLFLALLLLNIGCAHFVDGLRSHAPPPESASFPRLQPGPFEVESADYRFVDESRATMPSNGHEGTSTRTLGVTVWYPADADRALPLLVYSHGFSGNRREMVYLLEHLTSHGYVVAGLDFPLTNGAAPGGPNALDLPRQPGDVRFVIDSVLRTARDEPLLAGRIDPERIAALGLSYGGLTTTLVAFHPSEADPRIKGAISIAGPAQMFTSRFYANGGPPFLMIAGTRDALVPYDLNAEPLLQKAPRAALLTLDAGTHIGFVQVASSVFRFRHNPDEAACKHIRKLEGNTEDAEGNPFESLGGAENGIEYGAWALPCREDVAYERAMRPQRQHLLTLLGVRAFLDSLFAENAADREASARFLRTGLPGEMVDVRYR
ncbi:MAG: hypothetical protein JRG84_13015 [Deltaproteobacteria bacterium]|nr:hypothetical protein [Deltaproteobacteria bacterium]